MGIFKAMGMGLAIVFLKLLMPDVMNGFEGTLSALFGATSAVLHNVQYAVSQ